MPIYMDRHDVSASVTAESVAQMHREDLNIQDQFGCKGLTYWFDEKRKTAFCLIEALDADAIRNMHRHAHGEVPNEIIEVNTRIVESFLGRIQDPETARDEVLPVIREAAFRIIMVIVIERTLPIQGDEKHFNAFQQFMQKMIVLLQRHEGSVITQSDYHCLISFVAASAALRAAEAVQLLFQTWNPGMQHISGIKIALSAGHPVTGQPSVFEGAIKLAECMCEMVSRNIIVSPQVRDLYEEESAIGFNKSEDVFFLTKAEETFMMLFMEYMSTSWNNVNLRVEDFCKPVHCSKSQLYRKMVSLTGYAPHHFISTYRLREAVKLLNKHEGNIAEIAFATGFSSPSYFSKCFQKEYGYSPSQFLSLN